MRILVVVALVVSVGCSFIPAYTAAAEFRAASFVPADTWLFGEITLRPSLSQLANATRLANAFSSQPGWDGYVRDLGLSSGAAPSDVLPLLDGEIAIATFGSLSTSSDMPHYVLLAHSLDPDRLVGMLQAGSQVRGTPTVPSPRKDAHGANLYPSPLGGGLATFRGWLIVTGSQQDLNDALDRVSGAVRTGSLNDQPHFKSLEARLPVDRLGLEYVDTGALLRSVAPDLPMNQPGVPPGAQALLTTVQSQAAVSVAALPSGLEIRAEGATQLPPDVPAAPGRIGDLGDPGDAFSHLPADTLAAFASGLPMLTPEMDDALNAEIQQSAAQMDLPALAGLEVHPSQWLAGPIAIGGNVGNIGEPGGLPNLFLVAQVSDSSAVRTDLVSVSRLFPPKSVSGLFINGNPFFQAPLSETTDQSLTYGVANDWLYAVSGDAEAVVAAADSGGLTQNARFAALQSALGSDSTNLFIDIQSVRELATSMLTSGDQRTYNNAIGPLVSPLTYFGGSLRSDSNGDVHGHFVLGIADPRQ